MKKSTTKKSAATKSATPKSESPSRLIDARIKELGDWRGKTLARVRGLIKQAPPLDSYLRAYDVRTGKVRWTFHTIPHPGEFGYETWMPESWTVNGGANAWSGVAVDQKRAMVFAANQNPALNRVFTTYSASTPQLYLDLNREKVQTLGVSVRRRSALRRPI